VRTVGAQLRSILRRLRPYGLDGLCIDDALHELLEGWQQREAGIHFDLKLTAALPPVSQEIALVLYRVVQEALTNVVRHSQATDCQVTLSSDGGTLALSIADNGCGHPAEVVKRMGVGLLGMRERLSMVGGRLSFVAQETRGLRLAVSIPLTALDPAETAK
jgi:two-component system sensor histidine kinase UhpB